MELDEEQLREWIRDNLIIDTSQVPYETHNSVFVELRFKGEDKAFSRISIHIPEDESSHGYY